MVEPVYWAKAFCGNCDTVLSISRDPKHPSPVFRCPVCLTKHPHLPVGTVTVRDWSNYRVHEDVE